MSVEGLRDYRYEWKIAINQMDLQILRTRLRSVLTPDPYSLHGDGLYFIRSLYFDTPENKALREKLDGVNKREKFRIRYYNHDLSFIRLEKKYKWNSVGNKTMAPLTSKETQKIIAGDWLWLADSEFDLLRELYYKMLTQGLRPKTIVDYQREAYFYPAGGVRVTLDYDLRTGVTSTEALSPDLPTVSVPDNPAVMEVKWDTFLPDVVKAVVQLTGRRTAPFSKYANCRVFG
ncbi:polyphosphate polymerase domain-containing protein [bacterium]|nr:polyphosphate polymerase domain-containing protein [bacterium]